MIKWVKSLTESKDIMEAVGVLAMALLLFVGVIALAVVSWSIIGWVVAGVWNALLVQWFPQLPTVLWWQAAVILFICRLVGRLVFK